MIRHTSLCEAAAANQVDLVAFLIDMESTDLEQLGADGVSPLCAAATWGNDGVVSMLLDAGCDPNVRNADRSRSTALHVAACQEHGKIALLLLQAGADAMLEDGDGRTACDFASASNGIWPLFAARGLTRTPKEALVSKRIIHKVHMEPEPETESAGNGNGGGGGSGSGTLSFYSRPGSAYVRSDASSLAASSRRGGTSGGSNSSTASSTATQTLTLPRVQEDDGGAMTMTIDPLSGAPGSPEDDDASGSHGQQPTLSFWRD
jgi:hypothetical protein